MMKPSNILPERAVRPRGVPVPLAFAVLALVTLSATDCAHRTGPAQSTAAPVGARLAADAPAPGVAPAGPEHPPITFSGGAPSIDALLDEFMAAVERKDVEALHRLRISKEEFQEIIVPGSVPKGKPARQISEKPSDFFWALNDAKSRYFAQVPLLDQFGGRHYVERELSFTKGTREYAWYTAHGQVLLAVRTADDPHVLKLRSGTIAELDGRYKFISLQWEE